MTGESTRSAQANGSGRGLSSSGVPAIRSRRQTSPTSWSPAGATRAATQISAGRSAHSATAVGAGVAASDDHSRRRSRRRDRPAADRAPNRAVAARHSAGRAYGCLDRQERQRRRGNGLPQLRRQGLGALPREDRAVEPRAAGLAGRGGQGSPPGSRATPRRRPQARIRAGPRPARRASSGPTRPRRRARSRWAARLRRLAPASARSRRSPRVPRDAAQDRAAVRRCGRSCRPTSRSPRGRRAALLRRCRARRGAPGQRPQQQRVDPPAGRAREGVMSGHDRLREQPSHERGVRARRRLTGQLEQRRGERGRRIGGLGDVEQVPEHPGDRRVQGSPRP